MVWIVILIILALGLSAWYKAKDWGAFVAVLLIGGFVGFISTFVVAVFAGGRAYMEYPLVSMQDNKTIHGSFFLGSGNIDGVPSFTWYEQSGDSYYLEDIAAWKAEVRYTTGDPYVVWNCRNENPGFLWYPLHMDPSVNCGYRSTHVTFYVPEGSVKNDYTLDAK